MSTINLILIILGTYFLLMVLLGILAFTVPKNRICPICHTKKTHASLSTNKPHRGNYLYELIGTLRAKKLKRNPQYTQHYYQLLLTCENLPQITKIFVFKSKTTPPI